MLFPRSSSPLAAPRVVVTGAGIITALGSGWTANAEGFRAGKRAIRPVSLFSTARQRTHQAGEVALPARLPPTRLRSGQERRMDRAGRLLLHAAVEAWQQAGWNDAPDSGTAAHRPIPVVLGTTSAGMAQGEEFFRRIITPGASGRGQASRITHYQAQRQALDLMDALGFSGSVLLVANACASGANAIGQAFEQIRSGQSERVLAGGYDALSELVFAGFDALQALSPTTCRPFAAHRDGLALGEGAAVLTIESLASAQRRGAIILGEIIGYGAATDGHHLTQPQPQGDAAWATMSAACHQAGVTPPEIGYVNAHGTGTILNDRAEAAAIHRWAGDAVDRIAVSSTKAGIGHLLGAAGAVETVVCLMALGGGWLPPELDMGELDSECRFPVVQVATARPFDYALTNSFGFGGANASLVLRRWQA